MRIDPPAAAALKAVIESDLAAISQLTASLRSQAGLSDPQPAERDVIAAGYYLHNIYNALENTFDQVSRTFENHVKDHTRWHQELLHKMFLDMQPVRPAVLPLESKPLLDDLRGFRHRFRHSYDYPLDAVRIVALTRTWLDHGTPVCDALRALAGKLAGVAESPGNGVP